MASHTWEFIIPGDPRPNKRHRDTKTGAKYDPNKKIKNDIALVAMSQHNVSKLSGALSLDITFYMPLPTFCKSQEGDYHIKRPDGDNMEKLYLDALKHLYKDDAQICICSWKKIYSKNPRTVFRLTRL